MRIVQVNTTNRRQVKAFLELPFDLYSAIPQWVPPLAPDARRMLDRRRHPFYQHSDAAFYLAFKGKQPVGRIAVLDNRNYNAHHDSHILLFSTCSNVTTAFPPLRPSLMPPSIGPALGD